MTTGFALALIVLGLPTLAIAAAISRSCGGDDAAGALGVGPALTVILLGCSLMTKIGIGGVALALTPPALGLVGIGALVRRRRQPPSRLLAFPVFASLAAVSVLYWPFRSHPGPGVLGYNIANDSTVHAVLIDHFANPDRAVAVGSAARTVIDGAENNGYPLGVHELIASVAAATGDALTAYNSALAVLVAVTAFPAYWLCRRAGTPPALAAIGGLAAAGGYLQLQYYQQGFAPQMAATPLIFCTLGLVYEAVDTGRRQPALLAGVSLGGGVAVYSLTVAAYLAAGFIVLLAMACLRRRSGWTGVLGQIAVLVVGLVIVLLPSLGRTIDFARTAGDTVGQQRTATAAGNLVVAADPKLALGAWIGPDFRSPYIRTRKTRAGMIAAALLAALGVAVALARRRFALPVVIGSVGFASIVISHRSGIYYAAKSYQVLAVPVACAVVVGAWSLASWRRDFLGRAIATLAIALLGGWLYVALRSVQYSANTATITPSDIRELRELRQPGLGIALVPDDWAKYALPNASVPQDRATGSALTAVRPGAGAAGWLDSDSLPASSLERAGWIVEYRIGGISTPPPPFRLVKETASYRLWQRPSGSRLPHGLLPLEGPNEVGGQILRPGGRRTLPLARSGRTMLAAEPAGSAFWLPVRWKTKGTGWGPWVANADYVVAQADGKALAYRFAVARNGRYRLSMIGLPGPTMRIAVDGREYTPKAISLDARQLVASVDLDAGSHEIELREGSGGGVSYIRALALEPIRSDATATVCIDGLRRSVSANRPLEFEGKPTTVLSNCGTYPVRLDWIAGPTSSG